MSQENSKIHVEHNGTFHFATGTSAETKIWKNSKVFWSDLVTNLAEPHHTRETLKQYKSYSKEERSKIKDVGGYFGGLLRNGRRRIKNVVGRQLLTLDIDFPTQDFWDDFQMVFNNAAFIHGTHTWTPEEPRYRLIMPLDQEVAPDQYVAIARRVAGYLDIDSFDNTTFETARFMYWPSTPKDLTYYWDFQDGPWLDSQAMLDTYEDWTDSSQWPVSSTATAKVKDATAKQQDPKTKTGLIGAFCRTFTIQDAISEFLSNLYEPTDNGRYTYVRGSTASGLVTYDDTFAFSHHGTDPCSGTLCNAFDLVRIHKFGELDVDSKGDTKSVKAMNDFVRGNAKVKKLIALENLEQAKFDFADTELSETDMEDDLAWMEELEMDTKGLYTSTASNISIILSNDIRLKDRFKFNRFDKKNYVFKSLPWREVKKIEPLKDVDKKGLRSYLETIYGISSKLKIDDALALEFEKNKYHPVKDYLKPLVWDGVRRIDFLLMEFMGAEDSIYTREAMRKMLVGAVARIFEPGCKFDLVLTLVGAQGIGKSTFVRKLGMRWFSDTFMTVHGKEALEQIQGCWIVEMAELAGLRKADIESTKHFISKQEDTFRKAYAEVTETYPRQCVFFATTNRKDFLRDPSGNRRFLPVDADKSKATKNVFTDLNQEYVDKIWAEAVYLYSEDEELFLSYEANITALEQQKEHSEYDERKGIIGNYLDTLLPEDWYDEDSDYDTDGRRQYLSMTKTIRTKGVLERDKVCIAEIWCECLCKSKDSMDRHKTRELNDIMKMMDGWRQAKSPGNFLLYGKQRYYYRIKDEF